MADCRIVNQAVVTSVANIKDISNAYKSDGQALSLIHI